MAESTLSLKYSTLRANIGDYLRYGRTSGSWSTAQGNQIQACLDGGLRMFYTPPPLPGEKHAHEWTFMKLKLTLTTTAPYVTGTVSAASGVVTFSDTGNVPSWAADGVLIVNAVAYDVDTRDDGSTVTLVDTSVTIASGTSFELAREYYTMSDDFGGIEGPLYYRNEEQTLFIEIPVTSMANIRDRMSAGGGNWTGEPLMVAFEATGGTTGQRYRLYPWPLADDEYYIEGQYHAYQDTLASDEYPLGGEAHSQTILAACLAYAEQFYNGGRGVMYAEFIDKLRASVSFDRVAQVPERLGKNLDRSDGPPESYGSSSIVMLPYHSTYDGDTGV